MIFLYGTKGKTQTPPKFESSTSCSRLFFSLSKSSRNDGSSESYNPGRDIMVQVRRHYMVSITARSNPTGNCKVTY